MDLGDIDPDPIQQFKRWLDDAVSSLPEPTAMVLATADGSGRPSGRHVLLKGIDDRGFVWFTNYGSAKARDLRDNPAGRARVSVVPDPAASDRVGPGRDHRRPGVGRVLLDARPGQPDQCVGVTAERRRARSCMARTARGRVRGAVRRRRRSPPAVLGRLPPHTRTESTSGTTSPTGCTTASATSATDGGGWSIYALAPR